MARVFNIVNKKTGPAQNKAIMPPYENKDTSNIPPEDPKGTKRKTKTANETGK